MSYTLSDQERAILHDYEANGTPAESRRAQIILLSADELPVADIAQTVGLSKSTIYKRIADGSFPPPISLGERAVGWVDSAIDDWVKDRIEESQQPQYLNQSRSL